jgi:hypothetical protein
MTLPHGAGGLVSSVDDLAAWNATLDGSVLSMQRAGGARSQLIPAGQDRFFIRDSLTRIQFNKNAAGPGDDALGRRLGRD